MQIKLSIIIAAGLLVAGCSSQQANQSKAEPAAAKSPAPTVKTSTNAPANDAPHWDYEKEGPTKWATLSDEWSTCGSGKSQSPVDIKASSTAKLPEIKTNFKPAELKIIHHEHHADAINNGHTIQVNYGDGDTLNIGDETFVLKQYHFHAPSEHTLNGKHFPMEMHMVHESKDKKLAVIGVLIDEGTQANAAFEPIWANLPTAKSTETHYPNIKVDVNQLLPGSRTSHRYDGSLTTPPCSEGVKWIVFTEPIRLSAEQISKFTSIVRGNNRPTQPLNGRAVATDKIDEKVGV